jgi:hypothetical protein
MAPYSPLQMHDLDHQHEDAEDDTLLPGKHITSEHRTVDPASKLPAWTALALPVIAAICAFALYLHLFLGNVVYKGCVSQTSFQV